METGTKALSLIECDLNVNENMPDYTGPKNPTIEVNDKLSLIDIREDLEDEPIYIFSVLKLHGTGASAVEFYEGEFEIVGKEFKDD